MVNSSPTCTACHGAPSCAAVCGSAYSAACGIGFDQRGQPRGVGVIGVLMRDQDRREPGDAFEAVREVPRVEQHRRFGVVVNSASRHEWPKCVNCMPILCAQGWWANANDAGGGAGGLWAGHCRPCLSGLRTRSPWIVRRTVTAFRIRRGSIRPQFRCIRRITGPAWPESPSPRPTRGSGSRRAAAPARRSAMPVTSRLRRRAVVPQAGGSVAAAGAGVALARRDLVGAATPRRRRSGPPWPRCAPAS